MVNAKNQLTCVVPQVFNFDPYPYMSQYMSEYKRERMSGHISESMRRKLGIYIYIYICIYAYKVIPEFMSDCEDIKCVCMNTIIYCMSETCQDKYLYTYIHSSYV